MKRLILSFLFIWSVAAAYAGGIRTAAELVAFTQAINDGLPTHQWRNEAGEVCLEADIDMAKVKKFSPISSFGGVFDGQGFSIINWKARSGLIDRLLEGGVIRNVVIAESCSMKVSGSDGEICVGFIVNCNHGTVENCENHGSVAHKADCAADRLFVGGVVGSNRCRVINCRNYGDISSVCVASVQKEQVEMSIGGVVGGGYAKTEARPGIAYCENHGDVTYGGDMPWVYAGGVTGCNHTATVKYCVNRGDVKVSATQGTPYIRGCTSHVGGICASNRDWINGCDNFGNVTSSGTLRAIVGGIVGVPNAVSVSDCVNYGRVSLSNEVASQLGGIAGLSSRPAHYARCENRGEVIYEGYSPENPSYVGGIVGELTIKRELPSSGYLRSCVNYGKVHSGSGGNNYENDKSIHTGGLVGVARGNSNADAVIRDCANFGEVTSVTGKCKPFAAALHRAQIVGTFHDTYAESASPLADGSNIYGRVTTSEGQPVSGVVVSDGVNCVATGDDGTYSMTGDMAASRFVFISLPSGYEADTRYSVPQIFKRVRRYEEAVKADFVLKQVGPQDEYSLAMIGDPQMWGLNSDGSGERFRDVLIPDIETAGKDGKGIYAITLGDVVYNNMTGYDDYLDICSSASFPIYNVIGNHDCDQEGMWDVNLGSSYFENYISPSYYSFNIGDVHYVFVNSVLFDAKTTNERDYYYGITDTQLQWLKNDLSHVSKDKTIALCSHVLLFRANRRSEPNIRNFYQMRELLEPYARLYVWAGHSHENYGHHYIWEKGSTPAVTVARCIGTIRSNKDLYCDGTPNGYMLVSVKGGEMDWFYKSVGRDRDYQMRAYSPERTGDGYVKACVWNYSENFWTVPQWYEDGVLMGEMERHREADLDYQEIYDALSGVLTGRALQYATPVKSKYMFRIRPSEGVRKGEIRVTDNFGVTYTTQVEW